MLIEIYTAPGCSLCEGTKKYLNEHNVTYVEYVIGRDIDKDKVKEMFPTVRLLPVILVDGKLTESSNFQLLLG